MGAGVALKELSIDISFRSWLFKVLLFSIFVLFEFC